MTLFTMQTTLFTNDTSRGEHLLYGKKNSHSEPRHFWLRIQPFGVKSKRFSKRSLWSKRVQFVTYPMMVSNQSAGKGNGPLAKVLGNTIDRNAL